MIPIRYDWQLAEIQELYDTPLLDLVFQAAAVHREFHDPNQVQVCKLISIKTGGMSRRLQVLLAIITI